MLDLIFWFLFILGPLFAIILVRATGERLNQISLVNVTVVALLMFSVLGTLPLFYFWDSYRYESGVQDQSLILTVLFFSCVNIIFFIAGVIFIRQIAGIHPIQYSSMDNHPLSNLQICTLVILFVFCVAVLINYLKQIDKIAIVVALTEGTHSAVIARSDMGTAFQGKYHWYKLVMHDIGNIITLTSFALYLQRKKFITLAAFLIAFSYSAFVAIMAIEKAPFAWLLIGLFMVYFLVRNNGYVPFKKFIPFAIVLTALLMVCYIYFMGAGNASSALWSVFSRAFAGSTGAAYYYLEFFPAHQEYLLGRTFPNPGGLLPFQPYLYTVELMNWRQPEHIEMGVVGSAPAVFWTEAYANFGILGIPIVAFIMGLMLAIVSFIISKIEINPLSIAALVWLIIFYKDLSVTGFSKFLFSIYPIGVGFVVILILTIGGIRLRTRQRYFSKPSSIET